MVLVNSEWCKSCGLCMTNCPRQAIRKSGRHNHSGYDVIEVDQEVCIQCGICYTVCPDWVFEIYAKGAE